jgi:hypothetical protein
MKTIYFALSLLALSGAARGQTCSIAISYDDNGYRVKREKLCTMSDVVPDSLAPLPLATADSTGPDALGLFRVYPNPTGNQVNIGLDAVSLRSKCSVTLTDATGKALGNKVMTGPVTTMDLGGYADGIYFFILQRGTQVNTVRVVKQYGSSQ